MKFHSLLCLAIVTILSEYQLIGAFAGGYLRTVALTGDVASGTGGQATFVDFGAVTLNESGKTAFLASLSGAEVASTNDLGIWSDGRGSLSLIAREGYAAPGADAHFGELENPLLNDAGQVAFIGELTGGDVTSGNAGGIWRESPGGGVGLVLREGSTADELEQDEYFFFGNVSDAVFSNSGKLAFNVGIAGPTANTTNNSAVLFSDPNHPSTTFIARKGDQVPGVGPEVFFGSFFSLQLSGDYISFSSPLNGRGVSASFRDSIWRSGPVHPRLRPAVLAETASPGVPQDEFLGIYNPQLAEGGQIVFPAFTEGLLYGVWDSSIRGAVRPVALEDESAPARQLELTFNGVGGFQLSSVAASGETVFHAGVSGAGSFRRDTGIWRAGVDAGLDLIVLEGDPAPGAGPGVAFDDFRFAFGEPVINDNLRIAFAAKLTGTGIDTSNDDGLWAQRPDGTLQLIAREGDLLDVSDIAGIQDLRMIDSLSFYDSRGGGRRRGFNNSGEVAFYASFTDGSSGVFVSRVAAIPEPSALLLLGWAALASACKLRAK